MAFEKQSGKVSGRTPEQQAARDARKAAKRASEATAQATATEIKVDEIEPTSTEAEAESSLAESKKRKHNTDIEELEVDLEAPTPLNKKEARLAKKKAKRVEDGEEPAEVESKPRPVPVEKRNSIWIGNLSFRTTGDRIKEFLENGVKELGGDEGCVTRVNLPKEKNKGEFGPSKGYVGFASSYFSLLPSFSLSCSLNSLSPSTTSLLCHPSDFLVVSITPHSSARNMSFTSKLIPRFAFVDFSSPENQKLAVDLSEKLLEGRKLLIKLGTSHFSRNEEKQGREPNADR